MEEAAGKLNFGITGPSYLTGVDWTNPKHRRVVTASLVQGVHVLERDRQAGREGPNALATPWWEFFNFKLRQTLKESSIFGAIYEYTLQDRNAPNYVIAFRGTMKTLETAVNDFKSDLGIMLNRLETNPKFHIAMRAVREMVVGVDGSKSNSSIWLAGHSLGSATALLAGKNMAKEGYPLQTFLFNSPFRSIPLDNIIPYKEANYVIRCTLSFITVGVASAVKLSRGHDIAQDENEFVVLRNWIPELFVNQKDAICSGYIEYFEHRMKMMERGGWALERIATQRSMMDLFGNIVGNDTKPPFHIIPSANLTVNTNPSNKFKRNHGIAQWLG